MSFEKNGPTNDKFEEKSEIKNIKSSEDEIEEKSEIKASQQELSKEKSKPSGLIVALIVVVAFAAFFAGTYFSNLNSETVTKSDLESAISKLESKIESVQQAPSQAPSQPIQPVKISLDDDPIRGDPNAPITIVEFSDFQCPFCARFHTQTLPSILEEYIETGKVNFVYRDFPLQSIHPNAMPAAVAAECANEQGKYWEYHDTLFEKQNGWSRLGSEEVISTFSQYAEEIGLEQEQFDSCLDSGKYLEEVQKDLSDGREYGITGTPGFFIGNDETGFVKLSGAQPFDSFKQVIDAQLDA